MWRSICYLKKEKVNGPADWEAYEILKYFEDIALEGEGATPLK